MLGPAPAAVAAVPAVAAVGAFFLGDGDRDGDRSDRDAGDLGESLEAESPGEAGASTRGVTSWVKWWLSGGWVNMWPPSMLGDDNQQIPTTNSLSWNTMVKV